MANMDEIKNGIKQSYILLEKKREIPDIEVLFKELSGRSHLFPDSYTVVGNRINNLIIKKESFFNRNSIEDYVYDGLTNTVTINKKYFDRKDIVLPNLYMDIALNVAFYSEKYKFSGFGNERFDALNKGCREMLANALTNTCRSSEDVQSDEYIYANLFSILFDSNILFKCFLSNDSKYINELFISRSMEDSELFGNINNEANYCMKNRVTKNGKSLLDSIETNLYKICLKMNDKEKIERFKANCAFSKELFIEKEKHEKLDLIDLDSLEDNLTNDLEQSKTL